jgi:hypothetical protein
VCLAMRAATSVRQDTSASRVEHVRAAAQVEEALVVQLNV